MEGHLVHYNSRYKNFQEAVDKPDGLAVTGFFIQAAGDKDCVEFKKISDGIERIQKPNDKARLTADCLGFLKLQELSKHYYRSVHFQDIFFIVAITQVTQKENIL